jgi:hypothetical protein
MSAVATINVRFIIELSPLPTDHRNVLPVK